MASLALMAGASLGGMSAGTAALVDLALAGTAMSAVGSMRQANATAAANKYNANVAQQRAKAMKVQGQYQADKLKREKARMLGRQRALYAHSGVLPGTGTPLEVLSDTASMYEQDIANAKYNSQVGIGQQYGESSYLRKQAGSAKTAGYLNAGSTLLTGTASAMAMGK